MTLHYRSSAMARGPTHSVRLQPCKVALLLAAWLVVTCQFASGPGLPLAFKVLSPWRFKEILDYRTVTAKTYTGLPLADFNGKVRGTIFKSFARQQDQKLNPGADIQDAKAGLCVNGQQRSQGMAEYDWLRDGVRVQFKSSQMQFNKDGWQVRFRNVKLNKENPALSPFDDLLLGLYTPRGIFLYRHDLKLGLSTDGIRTEISGCQITVNGPRRAPWPEALDVILEKMDGSGCTRLVFFSLGDAMLSELAFESRKGKVPRTYLGLPLADVSESARGKCLHDLVKAVDIVLNPACTILEADTRGWFRGQCRVECRSAQLYWHKTKRCWEFMFKSIKFQASGIRESTTMGELLLALYTPRGIYIYRHDLQFGISKVGVQTAVLGHKIEVNGPKHVEDWQVALVAILQKFDANTNGCQCLAFIPFRRMEGWSSNELALAEPVQD
ncbi:unnamed protein product [Polarella glacialis]|uniref:Uncharacterized protein n=1 Tax=Polarella glacialis TaxID=89957 RepID=A0A813EP70_POLGL|nr:unnamed protein product [Polarella glacialis]